jgi:hypothetical protein
MGHDFGETAKKAVPPREKKLNPDMWLDCGLHKKNPTYGDAPCQHRHPEAT